MHARLRSASLFAVVVVVALVMPVEFAYAGGGNDRGNPTAGASNEGNGTLTVGVSTGEVPPLPESAPPRPDGTPRVQIADNCGVSGMATCPIVLCPNLVFVNEGNRMVAVCQPGPAADPLALALQAERQLVLPTPVVRTSPQAGSLIVQFETWLWLEGGVWESRSATASAGPVSATVTARPVRVRWDMGDGTVIVCDSPGTAWNPALPASAQRSSCSYAYRRSSAGQPNDAFVIRATVEWSTSWVAVGAPGGGALGPAATSGGVSVQVGEVQAIVTQ